MNNNRKNRRKKKSKENWKGSSTTLLWAPSWKGGKRWFRRLKEIQNNIDQNTPKAPEKKTRRRPNLEPNKEV